MRILHIINNLGSGGAEKLIQESLPLINESKGIEIELLLLTNEGNVFENSLRENSIKIDILPKRSIYNPLNIFDITRHIVKGEFDIVHAHLFPTNYWVAVASRLIINKKPRFVLSEHSTHNRRRERNYFRLLEKFIYTSYDKIISISDKTHENLITWLNPKQKNISKYIVIENGINTNKFYNAQPYNKEELNLDFVEDTKIICMVGRFSIQKNQATLIKSMKYLPEKVHLLLIGEGNLQEQSKVLAKDLEIESRVHFLGFRNDIDRLLKTSDIVVLSSNWEGFGLAAVEGMAAGKPVIASNVSGVREVLGNAGLLFENGDSRELARIILNLINDPLQYKEISKACLIKSSYFSIDKMVKEYINLYQILNR